LGPFPKLLPKFDHFLAEQFLTEKSLFRIHMDTLEKPSNNDADDSLGHWTSNIVENYTACYVSEIEGKILLKIIENVEF
jgi:hypothetical protein